MFKLANTVGLPKCVYEEVMDHRHSIKHSPADQWHWGERGMANLSVLSHLSPCQCGDLGHRMVRRGLGRGEGVWKGGCCVLGVTPEQSQKGKEGATRPCLQTLLIRDM